MAQAQSHAADEKVALITGASGGIGLAAGVALIRAGYRVFGTSRHAAPGEVRQGIHMLRCDVTDDGSVKQLIKDVVGLAGRIDVLVNNAGRSLIGAAEESSLGQARSLFDINVFGIIRTTTEVLPIMRKQGQGRVINISSVAGFLPGPYTALYNATKHAVEGYSKSLDHELRTFGIRVSLVEPVFTRTALEENGDKPDRNPERLRQGTRGHERDLAQRHRSRRSRGSRGGKGGAGCHREAAEHSLHAWKDGGPPPPDAALHP